MSDHFELSDTALEVKKNNHWQEQKQMLVAMIKERGEQAAMDLILTTTALNKSLSALNKSGIKSDKSESGSFDHPKSCFPSHFESSSQPLQIVIK